MSFLKRFTIIICIMSLGETEKQNRDSWNSAQVAGSAD